MGSLKILVVLFFLGILHTSAAQDINPKELKNIRLYTQKANALIWHINLNENKLILFQQQLNNWNTTPSKKLAQAPQYTYTPTVKPDFLSEVLRTESTVANPVFNYKQNLLELNKKVQLFNALNRELAQLTVSRTYYADCRAILEKIAAVAKDFVNLSYDFSLSCAINFNAKEIPTELDLLKYTVGQSKNVIMAMRENDIIQLKSYLSNLNKAIAQSNRIINFNPLRREGNFKINTSEIEDKKNKIVASAEKIAYWAEQLILSNQTDEDIELFLYNAIDAFNSTKENKGSAGAYNDLISYADNAYLNFTEEPLPFKAQITESRIVVNKEALKVDYLLTKEEDLNQSIDIQKVTEVAVFDATDENSLEGAKINNIVFLMDVSPSMLNSGKFPLLKMSLIHLMNILRPDDRISLVAYSGEAKLLYANASSKDKNAVRLLLDTLQANGGTDLINGLDIAYKVATSSYMPGENNKVIIASDGEFGVKPSALRLVENHARKGIHLSLLQINSLQTAIKKMYLLNLVDKGKGNYRMIENAQQAKTQLMKEVKIK